MTVDAVCFDFDDTLYPYAPCNEAGKRAAFETALERGYDFGPDTFESFYQEGRREVKRELVGTAATHERILYFKRALELHTGEPRIADARAIGDAYWDGYIEEMTLFPGVLETLETLRENEVAVAITTNLTTRVQLRKLDRLGLEPYIDVLVTSEEVGREKPGSVMFTLPLARLDCPPSRALMVGDSVSADVVGGNAAGLETVLFNDDTDDDALEGDRKPDHRIDAFSDLIELIR